MRRQVVEESVYVKSSKTRVSMPVAVSSAGQKATTTVCWPTDRVSKQRCKRQFGCFKAQHYDHCWGWCMQKMKTKVKRRRWRDCWNRTVEGRKVTYDDTLMIVFWCHEQTWRDTSCKAKTVNILYICSFIQIQYQLQYNSPLWLSYCQPQQRTEHNYR